MAGRRLIDRILAPAYLDDLAAVSADDLRTRLKDCRSVEAELSMVRTWLHAKLDILRSGLEQRGADDERPLLDRLRAVLTRDAPATRRGAHIRVPRAAPQGVQRSLDRLVSEAHLARLPEMGPEEVSTIVERLTAEEADVSAKRRAVHSALDALEAELVKRYQDGGAQPSDVLRRGG